MTDIRSVVVAGSRFGQFYAVGAARDPRLDLRGILGRGSRRSEALARRLGVPHVQDMEVLPDDIDIGCVVVGGAARGEAGPTLAEALIKSGLDVIVEHPLLPREWCGLLRTANDLGRRCLLNSFYPHLPAVSRFIVLGRAIRREWTIRHVEATCAVQVGFATLDVLAAIFDGLEPWSLEPAAEDLPVMRRIGLVLAETPASLLVLNELGDGDDGRMTLFLRISLTTDRGVLTLLDPHGPVLWTPAVVAPEQDDDGLFISPDDAPASRLWDVELPSRGEIHSRLWPEAAAESLVMLGNEAAVRAANQRSLAVTVLWQAITERIGFPDAPPTTLAPAAIETIPDARP